MHKLCPHTDVRWRIHPTQCKESCSFASSVLQYPWDTWNTGARPTFVWIQWCWSRSKMLSSRPRVREFIPTDSMEVFKAWKYCTYVFSYSFSYSILPSLIKSIRLRWTRHAARMEEGKSAFKMLTGKPTGKRPLGRLKEISLIWLWEI